MTEDEHIQRHLEIVQGMYERMVAENSLPWVIDPEGWTISKVKRFFPRQVDSDVFVSEPDPGKGESSLKQNRQLLGVFRNDEQIAVARWSFDKEHLVVFEIAVQEDYRRQGIATAMYDQLRLATGLPLKWQRTAFASKAMKLLACKYCEKNEVLSDDGNIIILKAFE